jgi:hypothetical protein
MQRWTMGKLRIGFKRLCSTGCYVRLEKKKTIRGSSFVTQPESSTAQDPSQVYSISKKSKPLLELRILQERCVRE